MIAFENTIKYLKSHYPNHFIIADAKRGDIGNTIKMYAQTFFEEYNLDSVTVAPYMGEDSVKPFLEYDGKWVILLALTSNKGSHDFQLTEDKEGERLFEKVLKKSQEWGNDENMMYVVGATQGKMFEDIRKVAPNHFLLVPGVGAQGGSLQEVCKYGIIKDCGLLVNSSRGIIYASNGDDFAEVAGQKGAAGGVARRTPEMAKQNAGKCLLGTPRLSPQREAPPLALSLWEKSSRELYFGAKYLEKEALRLKNTLLWGEKAKYYKIKSRI